MSILAILMLLVAIPVPATATSIITTVASLGLRNPSGVALDEDNGVLRLLVADGHPPR
jgi:hypothetical protein